MTASLIFPLFLYPGNPSNCLTNRYLYRTLYPIVKKTLMGLQRSTQSGDVSAHVRTVACACHSRQRVWLFVPPSHRLLAPTDDFLCMLEVLTSQRRNARSCRAPHQRQKWRVPHGIGVVERPHAYPTGTVIFSAQALIGASPQGEGKDERSTSVQTEMFGGTEGWPTAWKGQGHGGVRVVPHHKGEGL
jgi:hypothetical protein